MSVPSAYRRKRRHLLIAAACAALWGAVPATAMAATSNVTIVAAGTSGCTSTFCFVPSSSNISSGDTVVWTNQSGAPHSVTRCTASACPVGPGSGNASDTFTMSVASSNGTTVSHTFTGGGTYNYYCTVHGYNVMHGTVTVAAAATSAPSPSASPTASPGGAGTAAPTPAGLARTGGHADSGGRGGSAVATGAFLGLAAVLLLGTAVSDRFRLRRRR